MSNPASAAAIANASLDSQAGNRLWMPDQVLFTPAALEEEYAQQILQRVQSFDLPVTFTTVIPAVALASTRLRLHVF